MLLVLLTLCGEVRVATELRASLLKLQRKNRHKDKNQLHERDVSQNNENTNQRHNQQPTTKSIH